MDNQRLWAAVGIYFTVAVAWVLVSDWWLLHAIPGEQLPGVATLKGVGFVAVTSVALFIILKRLAASDRRAREAQAGYAAVLDRVPHFFESVPVVMYALEDCGEGFAPVWFSENADRIVGYPRMQLMSLDWWSGHIHPEDRDAALQAVPAAARDGKVVHEYRFIKADGTIAHIHDELRFRPASGTTPAQIVGAWTDITDRVAIEDALREAVAHSDRTLLATIDVVSQMVELRDPYTAGHERRVGEISAAIAAELGHDEDMQRGLRIAGAVHDVGKIVVPSEILSKPTRLNDAEFMLVKQHAQAGYEILKGIEFPWPVAEVARQHHERMDGSGYPRGLKGEEILIEARITAVADVVESMASHRPYRAALGIDAALAEIERGAGVRYDADVASACVRLFRERRFEIPA